MSILNIAVRGFGSVALAIFCVQLDFFALALALPSMAADFDTTPENLQWVVSSYLIATGVAMVPGSRLGDLLGRRKVLLIGLAGFGLASLWCGLSQNSESIIAARTVQGLCGGLYVPVAFALVSNATSDTNRPKVLGFIAAVGGIGTAAGPILGGAFSSTIGWQWVFFVNVPLALGAAVWGYVQLREQSDPALAGKRVRDMDFVGIALIVLLVTGLSLAIDNVSTDAGSIATTVVPAIVGIAALLGFVGWERRSRWPILPPEMWANKRFTLLVVAASVTNMGSVVMIYLATIFLQQTRGLSGLVAGLMFIPAAIGMSAAGLLSGRLAPRVPSQRVLTVAMVVGAMTLVALAFTTDLGIYIVVMGVAALFLGMGFQFGSVAVQGVVRRAQAGAAAGTLLTVMLTLSGAAVVAAAASIEAFGTNGSATQYSMTVTYLEWAALVGLFGIVFGLLQWRRATLPSEGTMA